MFEYDTIGFQSHDVGGFLRRLNKLASDGWQVICAINGGTLLIGRRLTQRAADEGDSAASDGDSQPTLHR